MERFTGTLRHQDLGGIPADEHPGHGREGRSQHGQLQGGPGIELDHAPLLAGIGLSALEADWFWIAQALYAGSALSALIDGVTRLILYRGGMP